MRTSDLMIELGVRLVLAALIALLVWWVDESVFGVNLAWWLCALIGVAVVFVGSVVILVVTDE